MKTIWKGPLVIMDRTSVSLPAGAQLLAVQTQNGEPQIWALVEPGQPFEDKRLRVYGTGHVVDPADIGAYVGTFQIHGGSLVFHVFEAAP